MPAGKMKDGNHADSFQTMVNGINIKDLIDRVKTKEQISNDEQEVIEKEVIRRLKIQNKKLLQQLSSLKKQVKQNGTEKKHVKGNSDNSAILEIRIEVLKWI